MNRRLSVLRLLGGLVLTVLLGVAAPAWSLENQLKGHASPYLAMHGNDPVAWQEWKSSILGLAQKEHKPIFISSGYFSCRWCHVMQRESYSNPKIAALLNRFFIPVKVDRELNPALDAYLIDYLERTRGSAGWPLNIFLTPEGYPLVGTTYMSPERFVQVLTQLKDAWSEQADRMRDLARKGLLELTAEPPRDAGQGDVSMAEVQQRFLRQALALSNPMEGGFGEQNKFPMAPQLLALLRLRAGQPGKDLDHLLLLTLDQMAGQGLRDQLGGGFFRYTVDPAWHVPHFEKMLYSQALLARVYLLAGKQYQRQDYLDVARDTLDFILREMRGPQGMFIASFSAVDDAGHEGAYYLWPAEELDTVLGEADAQLARRHWNMLGPPTTDGGYLPRSGESVLEIAKSTGEDMEALSQRIAQIREKLLEARAQRSLPRDTKELAGWNGLLLGTLAMAGKELDSPAYLQEAGRLADLLREQLWQDGRLWRAREGDRPVGQATLADYTYLADGLQRLLAVKDDPERRRWRQELLRNAWRRFHDVRGWRTAEVSPLPGMGPVKAIQDGALPAAPAVLMATSVSSEADRVTESLRQALPLLADEPFWYASSLFVE